tara:strand:- start:2896 stop:4563 length:1668 start_codon:yes stop_codon:yes gene_type:complete
MKWIGQNVYDFISRFRNDVYLESISSGTIASGGNLGLDSNNKIVKAIAADGDITGVTAGTGLSGGGSSGAVTLTVDFSEFSDVTPVNGDKLATLDSDGSTEQLTTIADLATLYAGTGLTASSSVINVNAEQPGITQIGTLVGLTIDGNKSVTPGDGAMLHIDTSTITDSNTSASGTASLYAHARIEGPTLAATNASVTTTDAATLYVTRPVAGTNQTITNSYGIYTNGATYTSNLTNAGSYSQTGGDMTLYDATNGGNPTISLGSSATERLKIESIYESGAQGLDEVRFTTHTAGSSANDGRFTFYVDETNTFQIKDSLVNIMQNGKLTVGNVDILSDSSGTTTLNNIDALDATTESTIETAIDTLSNLTTVGTIGTGTWQGTAIASAYTKHVLHYSFKGFAAGLSSGNWQYAEDMADAQFPFQLNSDYGNTDIASGSLTDVSTWFRSSGIVMPRAATAISMFGWATCGGTTNNISIAICKITPTRNSTGAKTPVVIATITFAALNSNDKMEDFEQTSITTAAIAKGDILMPFIISPYDGSAKTTYFNVTLEIEG